MAQWPASEYYLDVDWPAVHQQLGLDQVEWLLSRPKEQCQLFLDQQTDVAKLTAEFYDQQTLTIYHLMWSQG